MQDTVDPAAAPPRTLAQIIEEAPRGAERGAAVAVAAKVSASDPVTHLLEGRGEEAIAGPQVPMPGTSTTTAARARCGQQVQPGPGQA
jgi:hypothetical protein